ncbi:hypothetical protein CQ043_19405 [Paenibacillus sp. MYb63]|nr:hypothetical protein CQ043_19405 [Paenibacillus sp. MYb63]PRA47104.1 hypothetical protein CQ061_17670 [Paenibacillus sp. MYb67]
MHIENAQERRGQKKAGETECLLKAFRKKAHFVSICYNRIFPFYKGSKKSGDNGDRKVVLSSKWSSAILSIHFIKPNRREK